MKKRSRRTRGNIYAFIQAILSNPDARVTCGLGGPGPGGAGLRAPIAGEADVVPARGPPANGQLLNGSPRGPKVASTVRLHPETLPGST